MKVVDEKGKLFGKLNIIDLLVIVLLLVAVVLVVFKVLAKDGAVGAQHTVLCLLYTSSPQRSAPGAFQ